jgi:hypothetical protein
MPSGLCLAILDGQALMKRLLTFVSRADAGYVTLIEIDGPGCSSEGQNFLATAKMNRSMGPDQ